MRLSRLKAFSAYARPEDHLVKRTYHGAVVTLLGVTLATVLFVHELQQFLAPQRTHEMAVDSSRGGMLDIHINVTFPSLPCQVLSLDVKDAAGNLDSSGPLHSQHHTGMKVEVHKWRVDPDGRLVAKGEYVQPAAQMINTLHGVVVQDSAKHMQDMEAAIANSEGCIVAGELEVKRLAGAFFISVHAADFLMMQAAQLEVASAVKQALKAKSSGGPESHVLHVSHDMSKINISHIINKVAFGPEFPRQVNPLDGYHRIVAHDSGAYQYFLKIVPTTYHASSILGGLGRARTSHQYSVNEYFTPVVQADASHIPAVTFHYDLFPISMKVQDRTSSLPHFLVRICAVVGGCFALSGLLDQTIHRIASVFAPQAATPTRRSISGENGPAAASLYSGASGLPSRTSSAISASSSAADGGPLFPDGPHPQPRISRSSSGLPSY